MNSIDKENFEINSMIMKAFSDPWRLKILKILKDEPKNASELLSYLNITQPTLSHHMRILLNSGIVKANKRGKWSYYSLNCEMLKEVSKYISDISKDY